MAKKSGHRKLKTASAAHHPRAAKGHPSRKSRASPKTAAGAALAERFPIVGVGASAGGLEAFTQLLKALPVDTGMGFVLVQHMDPRHESVLAGLLQRSTKMSVREASDGMAVEQNRIYICPPNALMTVSKGALALVTRLARSFQDFPIDHFFVSLAADLKNHAIGVILSGTASDGTRGLFAIKAEGGITFAQSRESAQFPSMPGSAVAAGCVDYTLPPAKIAVELSRINGHPYVKRVPVSEPDADKTTGDDISKIIKLLRAGTGVDFGQYKPAMISRRIARRMALHKLETPNQYLQQLRKDRAEMNALHDDIFIHVTDFFRDPESLNALQRLVLAPLASGIKFSRNIRIWVPGCSTGEEVYSIGILLFEQLGERQMDSTIQIFGTDISERAIQRARAGIYPASSMLEVSAERKKRFFNRVDGSYQIIKSLRDLCLFAKHDLSKDPPFARMDLISCRNVLIYMGFALQKKIIEAFHYSLNPSGHLLLGKSESLSAYSSLFSVEDNHHKILVRRPVASPLHVHAAQAEPAEGETVAAYPLETPVTDVRRQAERVLLEEYAPAALVVDSDLQIIHFQGNTGLFLAPASGEPSFHLLRMIRPEFLADIRTAIYRAKKTGANIIRPAITFKRNGESSLVDVHVSPLKGKDGKDFDYLVVFREQSAPLSTRSKPEPQKPAPVKARTKAQVAHKEQELHSLREQLQAMAQEHEATNEEMRSMNEESLSRNEELQSTNEELETAKEELESSNEELNTLNDELQKRNFELAQLGEDLNHLLTGLDIPIVILDGHLRVRLFTPAAGQALNLISSDLGRPLTDIAATLKFVNWRERIAEMIAQGTLIESEVQGNDGRWYDLRMRPFRSGTDQVDGILLALVDIDLIKRSMEEADLARQRSRELEAQLALIGEGVGIGVWEYDIESGETRGSPEWRALYGVTGQASLSRVDWLARVHPEDHEMILKDLDDLITHGKAINREYRTLLPGGTPRWLNRRAELIRDRNGNPVKINGVSIDVTERKRAEQERQSLSLRLVSAQAAERQRIARDLHDGLIQDLAALAMDLGRRVAEPPASAAELKQDFQSLQSRVIKAADAARDLAYELHPSELDDLGLESALGQYCLEFKRQHGIQVEFIYRDVPRKLKREVASAVYKIVQEGLWNVAKHSKAKKAKVALEATHNGIRVRVEDKGDGFHLSDLPSSDGLGVASMRERVQLLNGEFSIVSAPGKGTRIKAEVPWTPGEDET